MCLPPGDIFKKTPLTLNFQANGIFNCHCSAAGFLRTLTKNTTMDASTKISLHIPAMDLLENSFFILSCALVCVFNFASAAFFASVAF